MCIPTSSDSPKNADWGSGELNTHTQWKYFPFFPHRYPKRLHGAVRRLLPECQVRFVVSERGSSRGAALVTAVAQRRVSLRQKVRTLRFCHCLFQNTNICAETYSLSVRLPGGRGSVSAPTEYWAAPNGEGQNESRTGGGAEAGKTLGNQDAAFLCVSAAWKLR